MSKGSAKDSIIIRSWPKVIFLYPVMLTALICGIVQSFNMENEAVKEAAGSIFFMVFCLNLLVISFEFGRFRTMSIVFFFFGLFFFLLYLSVDYAVWDWLKGVVGELKIVLSPSFYYCLALYFLVIFGCVFITTRFNYWQIKSNEVLHKEGFLGDVRRYPSPNLKMTKEINDVFEFLLLGAGRVVLSPASEKQAIVLNHVLRVNASERKIQDLLSSLTVEIHYDHDDDPTPPGIGG